MFSVSHHDGESCQQAESYRPSTAMGVLPEQLWDVCAWVGLFIVALILSRIIFGIIQWIWDAVLRAGRPKDFVKVYGRWAVITGSTDGIGKGYAMELARRGMDICLISRTEEKLVNVANEIKSQHNVEVKWIKADFGRTDIYDVIEKELSTIDDIGILVNNVGIAPEIWQAFCNHDNDYLFNSVNINITSCVMMTHIILKHMIPKNRGLIINVGSMSSLVPLPYFAVYSSTKAFVDNFSQCLAGELSDTNIELQCVRPGFVKTNLLANMTGLLKFFDRFLPFWLVDAETFTKSAVRTLDGSVPLYTSGYWAHSISTGIILFIDMICRAAVLKSIKLLAKYCWKCATERKIAHRNR